MKFKLLFLFKLLALTTFFAVSINAISTVQTARPLFSFLAETAKISASDGSENDNFGNSVAISGTRIVVGSEKDDDFGSGSGSAYVFELRNGVWTQIAKLLPSDGAMDNSFGCSVSISGNTIVIGSRRDNPKGKNSGSVYVFSLQNGVWIQTAKLFASDGKPSDNFGLSVAISGNVIVVGKSGVMETGSAYVFTFENGIWNQTAKLTASNSEIDNNFGCSVSIYESTIVVGSFTDNEKGYNSGSAYVFNLVEGIWTQTVRLLASDGAPWDFFGHSVSVHDSNIVVGAHWDDDRGESSGSIYVFSFLNGIWSETAKLSASDGAPWDLFGHSVSVYDSSIVASSYWDDDKGEMSGSVYLFTNLNGMWTETAKLYSSGASQGDQFGSAVAISGSNIVVGCYWDDDKGENSGSISIFSPVCSGGIFSTPNGSYFNVSSESISGNLVSCKPCLEGTFSNSYAQSACSSCESGRYQNIIAQTNCNICAAGKYSNISGSSICADCPVGRASNSTASSCYVCPPGTTGIPGGSTCLSCSAGKYSDIGASTVCNKCPAGFISNSGASSCLACPKGTFGNSESSNCTSCAAGKFSDFAGSTLCLNCLAGKASEERAESCFACPSGTYSYHGSSFCLNCEAGKYSDMSNATMCSDCPAGKISNTGFSSCSACSPGSFGQSGSSNCKSCIAGRYSDIFGATTCSGCIDGWSSNPEAISCFACPRGTFKSPESLNCTLCDAGTYSKLSMSTSCISCPFGFYSNIGASSCSVCSMGSSSTPGSSSCELVGILSGFSPFYLAFFMTLFNVVVLLLIFRLGIPLRYNLMIAFSILEFTTNILYAFYFPFYSDSLLALGIFFCFLYCVPFFFQDLGILLQIRFSNSWYYSKNPLKVFLFLLLLTAAIPFLLIFFLLSVIMTAFNLRGVEFIDRKWRFVLGETDIFASDQQFDFEMINRIILHESIFASIPQLIIHSSNGIILGRASWNSLSICSIMFSLVFLLLSFWNSWLNHRFEERSFSDILFPCRFFCLKRRTSMILVEAGDNREGKSRLHQIDSSAEL